MQLSLASVARKIGACGMGNDSIVLWERDDLTFSKLAFCSVVYGMIVPFGFFRLSLKM